MSSFELFPCTGHRLADMDRALATSLNEMLEKEVRNKRLELKEDYEGLLRPALERLLVDVGLQKVFWDESLGGEGHNGPAAAHTVVAALEQVGWVDTGLAFVAAHSLALQASMAGAGAAAEAACSRFAPLFCGNGSPVLVAFVLPGYADSDGPTWKGRYLQVEARRAGKELVLNGEMVRPTCSGADADLFGVLCALEGAEEPAFVLVPGDAAGLVRGPTLKKTGLAASLNADIRFDSVLVQEDNLVWSMDEGTHRLLSWYYLGLAAAGAGSLIACYEILKEWGDTRVIKGRGSIFKENPLTAALMGEVAGDVVLARALAYWLAGLLAEPDSFVSDGIEGAWTVASMVAQRIYAVAEQCLHNAMELMASAGYAREWQLERYWRDMKTVQCCLGSHELANIDVARRFYDCKTL